MAKPATTRATRENQLIALAMENAEEQLKNRTASSQVITHFLKLGTIKEQYELEKIKKENELLEAKRVQIESGQNVENLINEAIRAFKGYSGDPIEEEYG